MRIRECNILCKICNKTVYIEFGFYDIWNYQGLGKYYLTKYISSNNTKLFINITRV
jgi:hypothetical protein